MYGNHRLYTSLLATALAAATPDALADEVGFYTQFDFGNASIDETFDSDGISFLLDESTSSWRIAGGYSWTPYLSAEAAYIDFGSVSASLPQFDVSAEADGFELGLVFRWPVSEKISLTGRTGFLNWDGQTRVSSFVDNDSGTEAYFGIGAEYQAGENVFVTLGYSHYQLDDLDVEHGSLGLRWRFGGKD